MRIFVVLLCVIAFQNSSHVQIENEEFGKPQSVYDLCRKLSTKKVLTICALHQQLKTYISQTFKKDVKTLLIDSKSCIDLLNNFKQERKIKLRVSVCKNRDLVFLLTCVTLKRQLQKVCLHLLDNSRVVLQLNFCKIWLNKNRNEENEFLRKKSCFVFPDKVTRTVLLIYFLVKCSYVTSINAFEEISSYVLLKKISHQFNYEIIYSTNCDNILFLLMKEKYNVFNTYTFCVDDIFGETKYEYFCSILCNTIKSSQDINCRNGKYHNITVEINSLFYFQPVF